MNKEVFMNRFFRELNHRNRALYYFGWVNLLGAVFCLLMTQLNDTTVLGISAWIKPTKFFLSTTVFVWTVGWLLYYLNEPRKVALYNKMVILVFLFENGYILYRASRGELSHFNYSSGFTMIMFQLMGIAISVMTLWTGYFGVLFFRRDFPNLKRHYVWGIRFGLLFFTIFALAGYAMVAYLGHTVGAPDGSEGIPFVNWSTQYGDLRVAHFMGMHSLQLLPLMGRYVSKRSVLTVLLSIVYFLIVSAVFLQAILRKPLIEFYLG
jgi:hypothetical protein